ncbi:MAG: T9SS type A sorting domain-containing protein [Candidatus Kapaibacterium sp.]
MKKILSVLAIFVIGFIILTGQKFDNNDPRWNPHPAMTRMIPVGQYDNLPSYPNTDNYVNPNTVTKFVKTPLGVMAVSPNFMIKSVASPNTQSEVIITSSLLHPNLMFSSANYFNGSSTFSTPGYISTNGGLNFSGADITNSNYGDPAPMIDKNDVFIISHITLAGSMGAAYSTNFGTNWSGVITFPGASTSADKNLSGTNYASASPYYGHSYTVYTEFGGTYNNRIVFTKTTNSGVSWSNVQVISPVPASGHHHQGCDITAGPEGNVYAIWANCTSNGQNSTEDSLGFAKSTDGGVTWTARNNAADMNGIRAASFEPWGVRVAGFPRLDIDRSGGPRNGWIYVVAPEKNFAGGDAADIFLWRSSDQGTTWSAPIRVNQDAPNGKLQYHAAVNVDAGGGVNVVYHDCRNSNNNDSVDTYVNRSLDGGVTWSEIKVNDAKFRPAPISGTASGYQGDYIGITSANGKIFPNWSDNRVGRYLSWAATIILDAGPLAAFNLQTPVAGTTITSVPGSSTPVTISWDTSRANASYKWIFGTTLPTRIHTIPAGTNSITMTLGQLDVLLAGLGLNQGDSISGSWDVWAFRGNDPQYDSLKSANGPRTLKFKRVKPVLSAFNLVSPVTGTSITTAGGSSAPINIDWRKSGAGATYKWFYATPNFSSLSNIKMSIPSGNLGLDTTLNTTSGTIDALIAGFVSMGDSTVGQWRVYAYSGTDSLASAQTNNITFKRARVLTVGTGTTSSNFPFTTYWKDGRTQYLYLASELSGTNTPAYITDIAFDVIEVGEPAMTGFTVSFKNTTQTSLTAFINDGLVVARAPSTYVPTATGWNGITMTTPFNYTGGNLLMDICYNNTTYTSFSTVNCTTAPGMFWGRYNDLMDPLGGCGYTEWTNTSTPVGRANTMFSFSSVTEINQNSTEIPSVYSLSQNYPNPFNPSTKINFSLPKQGLVTLKIYDILGREVRTLVNEIKAAGNYTVDFNASEYSSGVYFYRLQSQGFTDIKKMMLIK